jgi:hypothetical protein
MSKADHEVVEEVVDEGQEFAPGMRVDYARTSLRRQGRRLEKAILGRYEVVSCECLDGDTRRLAVTLRPFCYG